MEAVPAARAQGARWTQESDRSHWQQALPTAHTGLGAANPHFSKEMGSGPQSVSMRPGGVRERGTASAHRPAGAKASSASYLLPTPQKPHSSSAH